MAAGALLALLLCALCPHALAQKGTLELPQSLREIGGGAFAELGDVQRISVPAGVEFIAEDAFSGCAEDVVFLCAPGSYAQTWATAHGYAVECGEGSFRYSVESGEATITLYTDTSVTEAVIPETLGGYPVTMIGSEAFLKCKKLKRVTIPPCVIWVAMDAFYQEERFTLTVRGELNSGAHKAAELMGYSFEPMDGSLKSGRYYYLTADGETTITSFDETNMRLTSVTVPATLGGCPVRRIGDKAFCNSSLLKVTLPAGLREIGKQAFSESCLQQATLPDSVERIGDDAFSACFDLTKINLPASLTSIGEGAFRSSPLCSELTIPAGTQTIGEMAFLWCHNLITMYMETDTVEIGSNAFSSRGFGNAAFALVAGEGSTAQAYAQESGTRFYLRGTALPTRGLTADGLYYLIDGGETVILGYEINAFEDALGNTLTMPQKAGGCAVTALGDYAMSGASWLKGFKANAGLRELGMYALNSSGVSSVTLNEGLERIGQGALSYCRALPSITIPSTVTAIEDGAFYWCSRLGEITVPAGVKRIGEFCFGYCTSLTQVTLSEGVEEIGASAFAACYALETIRLPDSLTAIGNAAFSDCGALTRIVIPESVTEIGEDAFMFTGDALVIVGVPGSCAHIYAMEHAIGFEAM